MRSKLSAASKNPARVDTALAIGAGIASQVALMVTGIIAARALGVADRGHFALIFLMSLVVAQFGSLGIPVALTYFIASDTTQVQELVGSLRRFVLWQLAGVFMAHTVVLLALFWSAGTEIKVAAAISVVTGVMQVAQQYALGVLQGLRRFRSFNVLRLVGPGGYALAAAASWVLGARSIIDLTLAYVVAYTLAAFVTVLVARSYVLPLPKGGHGRSRLRPMIRFGVTGLLGMSSPLEAFKLDQSLVGLFLSPVSLGLYVSAVSFTNLPRFIAQSIGMVAYPYTARQSDHRKRMRTMWIFVVVASIACAAIVVVLEVMMPWLIPLFFGSAFRAAIPVARILLLVGFLLGVRRILSDGARGVGKPAAGTIAEVVALVVLVPSVLVCVRFGLQAVAWGVALSALVSVLVLVGQMLRSTQALRREPLVGSALLEVVPASTTPTE